MINREKQYLPMSITVPQRGSVFFYKAITVAFIICCTTLLCATARGQSQKSQRIVKQINSLVKKSKIKSNGFLDRYSLEKKVLYLHAKTGETFAYDLDLVKQVKVTKGHGDLPFYANTYEVFADFDSYVSNYTVIWGLYKKQDALRVKEALEKLVEQVKQEAFAE
jgi:hypothetical protein